MVTVSSPSRIVWEYFLSLRLLVQTSRSASSSELARQHAALALIMSVTAVEVFLNMWFRVRVEESLDPQDRVSLLADLAQRRSIEYKLRKWPKRYLDSELDLDNGAGGAFSRIKEKRNAIVHFTSTHETIELGGISFRGMADTTTYDALSAEDATEALRAARNLVAEVFRLSGLSVDDVSSGMHGWTGTITV